MATKFKMRNRVVAAVNEQQNTRELIIESLVRIHNSDRAAAELCLEGVVDVLGTINAQMSANKPVFSNIKDAKEQRLLLGIVAGAKVLMDHPDAAEAHNLTPSRLQQLIQQADINTNAAKAMIQIAQSAPTTVSDMVKLIHTYNAALESGDPAGVEDAKRTFQKLWMYWQRASKQQVAA
jgi:hypothetical protein